MRNIIVLIILFFAFSCGGKEDCDPFKGEASAVKNGENWKAAAYAVSYSAHPENYDVILVVKNEDGFLRGKMSIFDIPKDSLFIARMYRITRTDTARIDGRINASYSNSYGDGDIGGTPYEPIDSTTSNDFVQITKYIESTGEIEGIFGCTLFHYYDNSIYLPDDSIKFELGKFKTVLKK